VLELEDYPWFPTQLRQFQMDFIGFVVTKFNFYDVFIDHFKKEIKSPLPMYDLCSGSGEPAITIFNKSDCFSELILSDKFPIDSNIINKDVLKMNFESGICYTMFNAFHHFTDGEKKEIVLKIQKAKAKGYFVEILEPSLLFIIKVCMLTLVANLIITPFIRPFSFLRIFFTYIIPINLFTITYDGVVSVLKSKSIKQYKQILPEGIKIYHLKKYLSSLVVIEIN
jgi:hypothetical protein